MASKATHEPRRLSEFLFIVGVAVLVLAFGAVAARGFPGGDGNGMGGAASDPDPLPTPVVGPTVAPKPEATRDPRDTWVPAEQFPGWEAIQPSRDSAAPGEPRVTVSDVEAYVAGDHFRTVGAEEIASIEFLPASEHEARVDAPPGRYGGRLLCVVDLRGSFSVRIPLEVVERLREEGKKPLKASRMILIFDALTGNLLTSSPRFS